MINKIGANQKKETDYFTIKNPSNRVIFKIDIKGNVFWLKGKKLTKAKVDRDLGEALGKALLFFIMWAIKEEKIKL